jgi:sigma-B regulation protein RsbU (phosphoserine phosphatase)
MWPDAPAFTESWRAYFATYARQGKEPYVGRHLISLLHEAGALPRQNRCPFFGTCSGSPNFEAMVANFIGIIEGARKEIVSSGLSDGRRLDEGFEALRAWMKKPDAALWYTTCWAEGVRSGEPEVAKAAESESRVPARMPVAEIAMDPEVTTVVHFLMAAAAELSSSLELEEVFHKIATGLRPLIDYHLFCVMLWNEETQLLENSFSMKYGEAISQKGAFPLNYGLSGSAAALRRPVRVSNVLEDARYVRFRHPEVEIRSELAVPLIVRDQLIGVIDLESTEFDYFTEQHEQMISALASNIATALVNARMHEQVLRDEQLLERDLATAREIQRGLLPRSAPHVAGLEIGTAYIPARELGGDFYDFLRYPDGCLAFAVGDAAGKATPAALMAATAVGMLRGHVMEQPGKPAAMLRELNAQLETITAEGRFVAMVAMVYGLYDERAGKLHLANAGLPRALLARNGRIEPLSVHGVPLGLLPDREYVTESLEVSAGDVVVVFSDGVTEAESEREEPFETTRLRPVLEDLLSGTAQEIADGLGRAALEFAGGHVAQSDDYTVVVLKFS